MSFRNAVVEYNAQPFPIEGVPMLTPFWADIDTRGVNAGDIRYILTSNPVVLSRARDDVLAVYPSFSFFNPTDILIATWDHVAHYNSVSAPTGLVSNKSHTHTQ